MTHQDEDIDHQRAESPDPVVTLSSGLYNGRLVTALPYTSRAEHAQQCLQKLQDCGIQLPLEQCRDSLQRSALIPELHRYIFFSSRGFGMVLAVVLYISIWFNLYSTAQMFTTNHSWTTSIPVTLAAAVVTLLVVLVINQHQKKINVNTDIRLAAANEIFMKHNVMLGISNRWHKCQSIPSICFVYFHLWGCQQRLSQLLSSMRKDALKQYLDQLYIFVEMPAGPVLTQEDPVDTTSEESPLLSSGSRSKAVLFNQKIPLVVDNDPHVMAEHLLVLSSACYVRLLVSGQLPQNNNAGHAGVLNVPCPCQFIEKNILQSRHCSMWI
ncbi:transmembrane protein 268 [Pelobates fuscus]|uniref:transmembrane protein 268 n=1 Tax=Pelobates fuscus TaxID=191477 RepID=UPI002FE44FA0